MENFDFPHFALSNSLPIIVVVLQNSRSQKSKWAKVCHKWRYWFRHLKRIWCGKWRLPVWWSSRCFGKQCCCSCHLWEWCYTATEPVPVAKANKKTEAKVAKMTQTNYKIKNLKNWPCSFVECRLWFCHCWKFGAKNSILRNNNGHNPAYLLIHHIWINSKKNHQQWCRSIHWSCHHNHPLCCQFSYSWSNLGHRCLQKTPKTMPTFGICRRRIDLRWLRFKISSKGMYGSNQLNRMWTGICQVVARNEWEKSNEFGWGKSIRRIQQHEGRHSEQFGKLNIFGVILLTKISDNIQSDCQNEWVKLVWTSGGIWIMMEAEYYVQFQFLLIIGCFTYHQKSVT